MGRLQTKFIALTLAPLLLGLLVHCGHRPGGGGGSVTMAGTNRPPVIKSAEIQPSAPTVQGDLGVAFRSWDADGDPVAYRFQWFVNGEEVALDTGDTLPGEMVAKGDEVRCVIVPTDGEAEGEPFVTPSVRIVNALPVIEEIEIRPHVLFPGAEAQAAVKVYDADGDPVSLSFDWRVNDRSTQVNGKLFPLADCKKRERISVRVRASDGEGHGPWIESDSVMVQNRAPRILSRPPSTWYEEEGLRYRVHVVDPDGDPVRVWVNGDLPPGMAWLEDARTLTWKSQGKVYGHCELQVVAEDDDGAMCTQGIFFTLGGRRRG